MWQFISPNIAIHFAWWSSSIIKVMRFALLTIRRMSRIQLSQWS
jgi:hypothetical protein